jgi:integrase
MGLTTALVRHIYCIIYCVIESPIMKKDNEPHLWDRGSGKKQNWYLRLPIPKPLRQHPAFGGKLSIVRPLETGDLAVARRKRDEFVVRYRRVFDRLSADEKMTPDQIEAAVSLDLELVAERYKAKTLQMLPLWFRGLAQKYHPDQYPSDQMALHKAEGDEREPYLDVLEFEIEEIAKSLGIPIPFNSELYKTVRAELVRGHEAAQGAAQERLAEMGEPVKATPPAIERVPVLSPTVSTETLSEALDAWLANPRLGGGKPQRPLTTRGHRAHVERFIKTVGNVPLSSVERSVAANYIANLSGRTRTRNSHRMSLWMLFRNAGLRGRFSRNSSDNPFEGLHQSLTKEERKKHISPLRVPELQAVLDSFNFETAPKRRSPATALPWASLVALYSGMRREEISQLVVSDIKECTANGGTIVTMRAHDEGSNNIKTEIPRLVPVHSALVRAGFLDYVAASPKDGPLFPGLQPRPSKDGRLSCRIGELFAKRLRALGIQQKAAEEKPTRQLCFHSLKHNVGQALDTAKESKEDIARVLGHAVEGISLETYSHEGPGLARVKAVIEAIQYEGLRLPKAI